MRVLCEQGLLRLSFAAVGAMSVCVDQLTYRQPVGGLLGCD
jgi:hypothetical protein